MPSAAFVHERLQPVTHICLCACDAEIIENSGKFPVGMQFDPGLIMCLLCFQTLTLILIFGTDTAVCCYTDFFDLRLLYGLQGF